MSTVSTKPKRFGVTFGNRLMYVNAASEGEALAKARTRLLSEHADNKTEPHADLATQDRFNAVARAILSNRY